MDQLTLPLQQHTEQTLIPAVKYDLQEPKHNLLQTNLNK